jgi:hypothetical protein
MAGGAHIRCMLKHGHLSRSWYAGCMVLCQSNSRGLPQLLTTQLNCKETSLKGRMRVLHYIHRRERSQITLMCWCMGRVAAVEIGSTVSLSGVQQCCADNTTMQGWYLRSYNNPLLVWFWPKTDLYAGFLNGSVRAGVSLLRRS